jgi:DNA replication and repair protein RecF
MYLHSIRIVNFRNLSAQHVTLNPGMNVFIGDNAQGKTNFLEAAACLADGRSFRHARIPDMIRIGSHDAAIDGQAVNDLGQVRLKIQMNSKGRQYALNGKDISDLKEFVGRINFVVFSAETMRISTGDPQARRNFLDRSIYSIFPAYLFLWRDYRKIVKNRNVLLKAREPDKSLLSVLTDQMVQIGSKMVEYRLKFIVMLQSRVLPIHQTISGKSEKMDLQYRSDYVHQADTVTGIAENLYEKLTRVHDSELVSGISLAGPHRDDLSIKINGRDVKTFGSRGQKRTSVISLKLSALELFNEIKGEYPVLILDDMAAELDLSRQLSLLNIIPDSVQILLSVTELKMAENRKERISYFNVHNGNIQAA